MRTRGRNLSIQQGNTRPVLSQRLLANKVAPGSADLAGLGVTDDIACLHGLTLRAQGRVVAWRGRSAELSYASYKILHLLAQRHPQLVSKQEIAAHLGLRSGTDVVSNARNYVSCLRRELRAAGIADLLVCEPRIGYGLGLLHTA